MSIWYPGYGTSFSKYLLLETDTGRDLAGPIQKSGSIISSNISAQTKTIIDSNNQFSNIIGEGFKSVANALDWGFDRLDYALQDVNTSIESLHSDFNYSMMLLLEQASIRNRLLNNLIDKIDAINEKLGSPTLTQSREFYKIGCEKLSKGLLDKALESFKEAEKKNDTDFFIQFNIGKLLLYGINSEVNIIDLEKAKQHFLNAARYAKAEMNIDASFSKYAAEAYLHASIATYAASDSVLQNKVEFKSQIEEAFQLAAKATALNPKLSEGFYHLSKYLALLGNSEESIKFLQLAIDEDAQYSRKVEFDHSFDLIKENIFHFIDQLKEKEKSTYTYLCSKISSLWDEVKKWSINQTPFENEYLKFSKDFQSALLYKDMDKHIGYIEANLILKKLDKQLPLLISNVKLHYKEKVSSILKNIVVIAIKGEYSHSVDRLIKEVHYHLSQAKTGLGSLSSYNDYINSLNEANEAKKFSNEANSLARNERSQKDAKDREVLIVKKEEERRNMEIEKLRNIRNEASKNYAVATGISFALFGLLSGCFSCFNGMAHGIGGNWNFIGYALMAGLIGVVIGAIVGQLRSK